MLQQNKSTHEINRTPVDLEGGETRSLGSYLEIVRRQFPTILAIASAVVILALLFLFTATPRYTSTASMVIDTRKIQLFQQQMLGDVAVDPATVLTQIEMLKSENVSQAVIRNFHLTEDQEFTGAGIVDRLLGLVGLSGSSKATSELELNRRALQRFERAREIKRIGLTYVMGISFTSRDPAKAGRIANAIADAYIVDQLEAKYEATRRASLWLQDRIKELRIQASAARRAVVDFKTANNIVDTGKGLMTDQQIAEVNSQLVLAHASTAEANARLERMTEILKQGVPDASVADALKNDTIVKLRGQYVDMASKESIWTAKYGADHLAVISLRTQMAEIRKNIVDELRRIRESYKSDYDIAVTREESIKASLANAVSESQQSNQAQIQLRDLDSSAQSYQAMYDNFLQRYMESVQQQSFPITEARVISSASTPLSKSYPNSPVILALALLGGLILGLGAAIAREFADRVFRSSAQVEDQLGTSCLAILPLLGNDAPAPFWKPKTKPQGRHSKEFLRYVVDHPLSRFSEALRSIKVAIDLNAFVRENRVLATTSTMPGEGKSTTSSNLAQLMAHGGAKVILVDADLRNPSLSAALAPDAKIGLVDVIAQRVSLDDALQIDPSTQLALLPAGSTSQLLHTSEILSSKAMQALVAQLRLKYDYVVLDLPPLAPVVDARVTSNYVDSYVFVIEWGKTKPDVIQHTLKSAPAIMDKILGVVLNKADTRMLARYESYQGRKYYQKYYARYGYAD
jgi:succinoglycan biosynthesis transport protein ExoP